MTELHPTISSLGTNPDSEPEVLTKHDFEVLAAFRKKYEVSSTLARCRLDNRD